MIMIAVAVVVVVIQMKPMLIEKILLLREKMLRDRWWRGCRSDQ
jgi:hypothetical protein